ncbi:MAG: response regulator transcription factor [Acidobacteria bacterium]|nr:response regulator transcription factor [Acidobacteriota bacterium]MCA1640776.1 response regulator transcription factor [Acidobacteriota bacterium]
MTIEILIADDHVIVREGIAAIISRQPDMTVVAEAGTGQQAVELYRHHHPHVVLMDLRMPVMNGVEATAAICRADPTARIILLTTYDGDEDIYRALEAGARAYLLKDMRGEELVEAIRAVRGGARRLATQAATRLAERAATTELTSRELGVLELLVAGKSNKEIAFAFNITEGAVKGYVNIIFQKLHVRDRTEATTTAIRRGLVHL